MTTNGEDRLSLLLSEAGDAISVPPGATARILEAAATPRPSAEAREPHATASTGSPTAHRLPWHRRMPSMKVAASVVVLAAIALSVASFGHGPSAPGTSSRERVDGLGVTPSFGSPGWADADVQGKFATATGAAHASGRPTSSRAASQQSASADETKIVATGVVALAVPSSGVHHAVQSLGSMAVRDGGYVASSNAHLTASNTSVATVVLRVPEQRFQALVAGVQRLGHVASVVTSSNNVTGQYVDYVARIRALDDSRTQYLAILARATTISDILAVQAQVNNLQSQIEQLEGQRNLLVNEAAYSTLTVAINQSLGQAHPPSSGIRHSVHESIAGFVAGFEWLVRAIGPALFALLCLLALWVVSRTSWRIARRRML